MFSMNKCEIAICSMIKDEQEYLKEWIEHHLHIGITSIYLYEDDTNNSTSHKDICDEYTNVHLAKFTDMVKPHKRMHNKQCELFNTFLNTYRDKVDYVAFIDIDEFVTFKDGYSMADLIDECNSRGAILLPWKCYGANGLIENPTHKVVDTFTCEAVVNRIDPNAYKSFVKVKDVEGGYMLNHHLHNMAGRFHPECIKYKKFWLNHYITKSFREYCDKLFHRGDIMNIRRIEDFFIYNQDMIDIKDELLKISKSYDTETVLQNKGRRCKPLQHFQR